MDESGFAGRFDVYIRWARTPDDPAAVASTLPSLITALYEKYGLKVESRKVPVVKVVIDYVNRVPTEN